jgi:hypothetical protein
MNIGKPILDQSDFVLTCHQQLGTVSEARDDTVGEFKKNTFRRSHK